MKQLLFFKLIFLGLTVPSLAQDNLLTELNATLEKKEQYVRDRQNRISFLERKLNSIRSDADSLQFDLLNQLTDEYKTFIYESAFLHTQRLRETAARMQDPVRIAHAKIQFSFILLSSGMFKEALDSLLSIRMTNLPDTLKINYFSLLARTYYDFSDFARDNFYAPQYIKLGNQYIDSARQLCAPDSYDFLYLRALRNLKNENNTEAIADLNKLLDQYKLTLHQVAVTTSTLSNYYINHNQPDEAITLLARAARADIESATKETSAMVVLAELLHKKGDIANAYVYVQQAMEDAVFYGARQRKVQVGAILPVIAADKLHNVEAQRRLWFIYATIITVLSILVIVLAFVFFRQLVKLRRTRKALVEANHIKEEYIGYYFNVNSDYLNKAEVLKQAIENKLMTKKIDDIKFVINNFNLKKDREELYHSFDVIFLKLFPDFVEKFNAYFKEEDRIVLKEGQLLTTELRIFAIIRLGIHDTEKIAKILDYSINTIYNYKARIKSKSTIANELFEKKIMEIDAVELA